GRPHRGGVGWRRPVRPGEPARRVQVVQHRLAERADCRDRETGKGRGAAHTKAGAALATGLADTSRVRAVRRIRLAGTAGRLEDRSRATGRRLTFGGVGGKISGGRCARLAGTSDGRALKNEVPGGGS